MKLIEISSLRSRNYKKMEIEKKKKDIGSRVIEFMSFRVKEVNEGEKKTRNVTTLRCNDV